MHGPRGTQTQSVASRDLLAAYIGQLGSIPLYTAAQELSCARDLEGLENRAWALLLGHPKGAQVALNEASRPDIDTGSAEPMPERLKAGLGELLGQYARTTARSPGRRPAPTPAAEKLLTDLADRLRFYDRDKVLLDQILGTLRQEIWGRQVMPSAASLRLSREDMVTIEAARTAALRARNAFVRANLRLVVSVARGFHHYRVPFIDLIQEGNMGLMKAVHRFDYRRGFRFSTYAHWWIRQSIERAIINKANQVRIPVHVVDARRQVHRANNQLTHALGRQPTPAEIGQAAQMSPKKVEQLLWTAQPEPISLDEPVGGDDSRRIVDMVPDENQPLQDLAVMRENTNKQLHQLLQKLNEVERDIIERRFGLRNTPQQQEGGRDARRDRQALQSFPRAGAPDPGPGPGEDAAHVRAPGHQLSGSAYLVQVERQARDRLKSRPVLVDVVHLGHVDAFDPFAEDGHGRRSVDPILDAYQLAKLARRSQLDGQVGEVEGHHQVDGIGRA